MEFKKQISEYLHFMRKKWNYSHDLFSAKQREEFISLEAELKSLQIERGFDKGERLRLEQAGTRLEKLFPAHLNLNAWAENVEVIFVAIILALAIRTYFYQPFKIPTDSMKPTLWGIARQVETEPLPNFFVRLFDLAAYGKSYHELIAKKSGTITSISESKLFDLLPITTTNIQIEDENYRLFCSRQDLGRVAPELLVPGHRVEAGQVVVRFSRSTGDQVFVNRWLYHFRTPKQGEVFVFTTHDIPGILDGHGYGTEQYYIKRCVGTAGMELQLDPPYLLSDGKIFGEELTPFQKIYSRQNGYRGYTFLPGSRYLTQEGETVQLPADSFWAMGDNSPQSSDSRAWGFVPRKNLIGTGSFVYWPFGERWGRIK
jgi:signal peptidase I